MTGRIFSFFIFVFALGFTQNLIAKSPAQGVSESYYCSTNPGDKRCSNLAVVAVPQKTPSSPPAKAVNAPPLQIPNGVKPNANGPISQAPAAATSIMNKPIVNPPSATPKASAASGFKSDSSKSAGSAKSKTPPKAAAASPSEAKPLDSESQKFVNFCDKNPGHKECGGSGVTPNPKYITKEPVQVNQVVKENPKAVNRPVVERPAYSVQQRDPIFEQPTMESNDDQIVIRPEAQSYDQPQAVPQAIQQVNQPTSIDVNQQVEVQAPTQQQPAQQPAAAQPEQTERREEATANTAAQQNNQQQQQQNVEQALAPLTDKERKNCQSAEDLVYQCQSDFAPAEKNCDPEDGKIGEWTRGMQTATSALTSIAQSSIQTACSGMVTMTGGMNVALAAFETMCQSSREACVTSCYKARQSFDKCPENYKGYATLKSVIGDVEDYEKECKGYGNRVDTAKQNVNGVMAAVQNAQQCAAYTKAMNQPGACQRDPSAPGCAGLGPQNCDNPAFAASNMVCACLRNPMDPRCQASGAQSSTGFGAVAGGIGAPTIPGGMGGGFGENAGGGGPGMDFSSLSPGAAGGAGAPGEDPGGKKGSGAPLNPNTGGGNGGSSAGGNGGSGHERNNQQVYNGNWGSSGGGGGFGVSRSGASYGNNGYYRNPSATDLNQFRPAGRLNKFSPGLSGLTGPDGLTGANSDTIWQKVRNRYQAKSYSLKQRP